MGAPPPAKERGCSPSPGGPSRAAKAGAGSGPHSLFVSEGGGLVGCRMRGRSTEAGARQGRRRTGCREVRGIFDGSSLTKEGCQGGMPETAGGLRDGECGRSYGVPTRGEGCDDCGVRSRESGGVLERQTRVGGRRTAADAGVEIVHGRYLRRELGDWTMDGNGC